MNTYCENPECQDPFDADEASDGLYCCWECKDRAQELEDDGDDGRCHGCSGTCCTGVGSEPCTC